MQYDEGWKQWTNSMQDNPSREGDSCSASQIPHILEPEGSLLYSQNLITGPYSEPNEYGSHPLILPVPILSQLNPVHNLTSDFFEIHFNIILPYTPRSSKWSVTFRFSSQNVCSAYPSMWITQYTYGFRPTKCN
jgi:hypothetical protein